MYYDKLDTERRVYMKKIAQKYGMVTLLYLVIFFGIVMLNSRYEILNKYGVEGYQNHTFLSAK